LQLKKIIKGEAMCVRTRLIWAIGFLPAICAQAATSPEVMDRSWAASVELTGAGNPERAISQMRAMADLNQVVYSGVQYHQDTRTFVDAMWGNLESFNLSSFYRMLPEENGDWRQLRAYGARAGSQYNVGPKPDLVGIPADGEPAALGDMSMLVQAKKIQGELGQHYLMRGAMTLGMGDISWSALQLASAETLKVLVDGMPADAPATDVRAVTSFTEPDITRKILTMSPALGAEDVAIIAPLWASFPALWELLAKIGRIDDLVYVDSAQAAGQPYRRLKMSFSIDPARMRITYPHIVAHLQSMKRLFKGSMRVQDERGQLFSAQLDTAALHGSFEAVIANGQIVPVQGEQVVLDSTVTNASTPHHYTALMDSTMTILGVVTHIENAKASVSLSAADNGATLQWQMNEVPTVKVQGNAFGILPTAMIDVMMPRNLNQIVEEFMTVACKGNEGNGMLMGAHFQGATGSTTSRLTLNTAFEGLDNIFVRIGMGIVNDRMLPDPRVAAEIDQLFYDTQLAFASDLDGFEALSRSSRLAASARQSP